MKTDYDTTVAHIAGTIAAADHSSVGRQARISKAVLEARTVVEEVRRTDPASLQTRVYRPEVDQALSVVLFAATRLANLNIDDGINIDNLLTAIRVVRESLR